MYKETLSLFTLMLVAGCNTGSAGEPTQLESTSLEPTTAAEPSVLSAEVEPLATSAPFDRAGFKTRLDEDGRLWVFGVDDEVDFPDKHVTLIGAAPGGKTLKALDKNSALTYLATKEGFDVEVEDGRLWVWPTGSDRERSEKHVTLVAAGPRNMTVKALDKNTALAYVATKPGFAVEVEDGRLWVWPSGAEREKSEKHATLVAAGPRNMTVKALDKTTALAYVAAVPGFQTEVHDGRIWVWEAGVECEMTDKHATLVGAGPRGMTVKSVDVGTARAYAAAFQR